ncbi:MAG: stage II sporulation protein M [Oscillospiraceae bacterium]
MFEQESNINLAFLAFLFSIGLLAGVYAASFIEPESVQLQIHLTYVLSTAKPPSSFREYFLGAMNLLKYQFAAILLGFSFLGAFLIPLLMVFRSFMLAYSFTAVIKAFGSSYVSMAVFCVPIIFSIPAFFAASSVSFFTSIGLLRRVSTGMRTSPAELFSKRQLLIFVISTLVLIAGSVIDIYVTPALISTALSRG